MVCTNFHGYNTVWEIARAQFAMRKRAHLHKVGNAELLGSLEYIMTFWNQQKFISFQALLDAIRKSEIDSCLIQQLYEYGVHNLEREILDAIITGYPSLFAEDLSKEHPLPILGYFVAASNSFKDFDFPGVSFVRRVLSQATSTYLVLS